MKIEIKIKRGEHQTSYHTYNVPFTPKMRVLDALFHIQENDTPDLAFRWNCGEGICGSCAAEVNGKPVLMCKHEITLDQPKIIIEPLKVFPRIKDLVTDPSEVYEKLTMLKPYFHPIKNHPSTMHEEQVKEIQEMRKCIDCFICYDSCHIIKNHKELSFPGPINILKSVSLDRHPWEREERSSPLVKQGLWNCNVTRCCTQNCPQDIKITEDAIIYAKERAVSTRKK